MFQGTSRDVLENENQRGGICLERARAVAGALSGGPRHPLQGTRRLLVFVREER